MRRSFATVAAALALGLAASARAQMRVNEVGPRIAPAGAAAAPAVFAPPALSASILMPAAEAPSASPPGALAAASSAGPERAQASELSAAAAPASASAPAGNPRDWEFSRWLLPKSADGSAWRFRDLPFLGARLWDGARAVPELGSGAMGTVFVHPSRPDSVIKVARRGYAESAGQYMAPDDETVLAYEDYDLARLAALGAAPRPLARLTISGRPASERVYGSTVSRLKRAGLFGPREHALVHELLGRIAQGGFIASDLNLGNIMIGRRAGDARERAWLVDTLGVSVNDGLDAAGRKARMTAERVPWLAFQGFGFARPLGRLLDEALQHSRPQ